MGSIGLCNPSSIADFEFNASVSITPPLIHANFSAAVLSDQR